jgi:hypothetical protein
MDSPPSAPVSRFTTIAAGAAVLVAVTGSDTSR